MGHNKVYFPEYCNIGNIDRDRKVPISNTKGQNTRNNKPESK